MLSLMPPRTLFTLLAARALLAHVQLATDQDSQLPFHGAAFQHLIPQTLYTCEVAPSQEKNPTHSLAELHMGGLAQSSHLSRSCCKAFLPLREAKTLPIQYHLQTLSFFKSYNQVIYEDVETMQGLGGALCNHTSDQSPA
ncbi:hypothetical protein DUI87_04891 [Hirundo rustica rustica]|uniref:Uncharacterized protein n=1 Tax=Hirundo rustica rustica TaxID=333673 RepID=A0A3M0KXX8_HIRRU|nr:hypothetical protein DUI87_04891 [Hirundo rustica rustica]